MMVLGGWEVKGGRKKGTKEHKQRKKNKKIKAYWNTISQCVKNEHSIITIYIKYLHFNQTPNKKGKNNNKKKRKYKREREREGVM